MRIQNPMILAFTLFLLISFSIAGCNAQTEESQETEKLKVALCLSGPITDGGWNAASYEGLLVVKEEFDFEINYSENVKQDEQLSVMRDYASAGYDIIIGHGFQYGDTIVEIAADYPDIWFVQIGGETGGTYPNITSGVFRTAEAGYLVGLLSGELTESGVVGFVGAMELPTIVEVVSVCKEVNEQLYGHQMVAGYTGSWEDVSGGYEAAISQIQEGVDVIIGIGGATDLGVIQACAEQDSEIWYIGWSGDLNTVEPEIVATSMREDIGRLMLILIQQHVDGEEGTHRDYGVYEGAMYFGTWSENVPDNVKEKILAEQQKFIDGEMNKDDVYDLLNLEPIT